MLNTKWTESSSSSGGGSNRIIIIISHNGFSKMLPKCLNLSMREVSTHTPPMNMLNILNGDNAHWNIFCGNTKPKRQQIVWSCMHTYTKSESKTCKTSALFLTGRHFAHNFFFLLFSNVKRFQLNLWNVLCEKSKNLAHNTHTWHHHMYPDYPIENGKNGTTIENHYYY